MPISSHSSPPSAPNWSASSRRQNSGWMISRLRLPPKWATGSFFGGWCLLRSGASLAATFVRKSFLLPQCRRTLPASRRWNHLLSRQRTLLSLRRPLLLPPRQTFLPPRKRVLSRTLLSSQGRKLLPPPRRVLSRTLPSQGRKLLLHRRGTLSLLPPQRSGKNHFCCASCGGRSATGPEELFLAIHHLLPSSHTNIFLAFQAGLLEYLSGTSTYIYAYRDTKSSLSILLTLIA
ncbi:hypothetical protein FB45DRAFT_905082 [Roridomyces roridus]|uniref:Uncharacterized protein n=1 Tax=Roridomyces roridus TaxID=1738132 RepID=A0AAD7C5I7_9AGAR|nr:hypothetical protein FB45DRAFT_905082 [Roridomyces roridus]